MFKAAECMTESLCVLRKSSRKGIWSLSVNVKTLKNLGQKMITGISFKLAINLLHSKIITIQPKLYQLEMFILLSLGKGGNCFSKGTEHEASVHQHKPFSKKLLGTHHHAIDSACYHRHTGTGGLLLIRLVLGEQKHCSASQALICCCSRVPEAG